MFKQVNWISQSELENSTIEVARRFENFLVFKTNRGYYAVGIWHDSYDDSPSRLYENRFEKDVLREFQVRGIDNELHFQFLIDLDLIKDVEQALKLIDEIKTAREIRKRKDSIEAYERNKAYVQANYPDYFENKKE